MTDYLGESSNAGLGKLAQARKCARSSHVGVTISRIALRNHAITRLWTANNGVAALEFALIAPVFVILIIGMVDLGLAYSEKLQISAGVSFATYYAFQKGQNIVSRDGALAYISDVSEITKRLSSSPNSEITVDVKYNNDATGDNAAQFYCVSGYPPVYMSSGLSSVGCGGTVMSGKFLSIEVKGRIVPFFVSEGIFGSYLNVSEAALVRVR